MQKENEISLDSKTDTATVVSRVTTMTKRIWQINHVTNDSTQAAVQLQQGTDKMQHQQRHASAKYTALGQCFHITIFIMFV